MGPASKLDPEAQDFVPHYSYNTEHHLHHQSGSVIIPPLVAYPSPPPLPPSAGWPVQSPAFYEWTTGQPVFQLNPPPPLPSVFPISDPLYTVPPPGSLPPPVLLTSSPQPLVLHHSNTLVPSQQLAIAPSSSSSSTVLSCSSLNRGTLVVFNLEASMESDAVRKIFEKYGSVKEVREAPLRKQHKFVEFFDARHAEAALLALDGTEMGGRKLKIEYSRPRGHSRRFDLNRNSFGKSATLFASTNFNAASTVSYGVRPQPPTQFPNGPQLNCDWGWPFSSTQQNINSEMSSTTHASLHLNMTVQHMSNYSSAWHAPLLPVPAIQQQITAAGASHFNCTDSVTLVQENCVDSSTNTGKEGTYVFNTRSKQRAFNPPRMQHQAQNRNHSSVMDSSNATGNNKFKVDSATSGSKQGVVKGHQQIRKAGNGRISHPPCDNGVGSCCGSRAAVVDPEDYKFDESEAAASALSGGRTTLMIRNIPNKYTQQMLISMLDEHCLEANAQLGDTDEPLSAFDFVYLPIDFKNRCNLGYAFVNFTSPQATLRLHRAFHGRQWEEFNSRKICEVTYARLQGREALEEHFKNSRFACDTDEYLPMVFRPARTGEKNDSAGAVALASNDADSSSGNVACDKDTASSTPSSAAMHCISLGRRLHGYRYAGILPH